MGRIRGVPVWVRRPPAVVAEVEDFLLRLHGRTRSPEVLGAWSTLAWLGGLHPEPPLTVRPDRVTQDRAIAEFLIAQRVSAAEPYPTSAWWAEQGCGLDAVLDQGWWSAHTDYGYSAQLASGVAVAVGWAFGVIEDAATMTPHYTGDGTPIPDADRTVYGRELRRLSPTSRSAPQANSPPAGSGSTSAAPPVVGPGSGQVSASA